MIVVGKWSKNIFFLKWFLDTKLVWAISLKPLAPETRLCQWWSNLFMSKTHKLKCIWLQTPTSKYVVPGTPPEEKTKHVQLKNNPCWIHAQMLILWCVTCTECHSCSTPCLNNPQDSPCLNVLLHLSIGQCQLCFLSPSVFCAYIIIIIISLHTRWGCMLSCVSDKQTSCPCKHFCICAVCMHVSWKDKGSDKLSHWHQHHNNIGY